MTRVTDELYENSQVYHIHINGPDSKQFKNVNLTMTPIKLLLEKQAEHISSSMTHRLY